MARHGCLGGCLRSFVIILLIIIALPIYMYFESRMLLTEESTVRLRDLPAELQGLRIAFVADIHAGRYRTQKDIAGLVEKINALDADLILLGGDYVANNVSAHEWVYEELALLSAPLGVIAVAGNHDLAETERGMLSGMQEAGIGYLDNQTTVVSHRGASLYIVGACHGPRGRDQLEREVAKVPADAAGILLAHDPEVLAELRAAGLGEHLDLSLAGHTHGGQISLFGYWFVTDIPFFLGKSIDHSLVRGWSQQGGVTHLTTRGAGASIPLRFLSVPQIHAIILERDE